jgi:hypothetical protein
VGADLVAANMRRLPDGGFLDHFGVSFVARDAQELIERRGPLMLRNAEPLVIGIEHRIEERQL